MPTYLWPTIPSMYNWMFGDDDDDEGGLSGEAGEMKLDINLEDDIWDKIWYTAKSALGWFIPIKCNSNRTYHYYRNSLWFSSRSDAHV